jgi:sporulation protein YlmC with PRC-barrel domain
MSRGFYWALIVAFLCAASCGVIARADSQGAKPQSKQTGDQSAAQKPLNAPPAKTETPAVLVDDAHLESILGKEIHTSSGETLGNVTDVLVEADGSVRAAVIDLGGFLGVGVRKIVVAWSVLHFVQGKTALSAVLDMSKDQLRVAPEYRAGEPIVIVGAVPKSARPPPTRKD